HQVIHGDFTNWHTVAQHPATDHAQEAAQEVAYALPDGLVYPGKETAVCDGVALAAAFHYGLLDDVGGCLLLVRRLARVDHAFGHAIQEGAEVRVLHLAAIHQHGACALVQLLALLAVGHFVQEHSRPSYRVQVRAYQEREPALGVVEAVDLPGFLEQVNARIQRPPSVASIDGGDPCRVGAVDHDQAATLLGLATREHLAHGRRQTRELHVEGALKRLLGHR